MEINFYFNKGITLKNRTALKSFIAAMFKKESRPLESLQFIFCEDEFLLGINRQYLQHDYYTDIITFDLSTKPAKAVIGEIYISIDRVRDNAKTLNTFLNQELHRVIFHGVLHLCGYKDKTKKDQSSMRAMEDYYLGLYGLL